VTREPVGALQSDDLSISAVQGDACELPEQIRREQFDLARRNPRAGERLRRSGLDGNQRFDESGESFVPDDR
jgi:hypothetical protein